LIRWRKSENPRSSSARISASRESKCEERCVGSLRLLRKTGAKKSIGKKRFSIESGHRAKVTVKLGWKASQKIPRRGLRVLTMGTARDLESGDRTTSRRMTIKRPRR